MKIINAHWGWTTLIVSFVECHFASAQTQGVSLEEVTVTAQKRVENAQDVPASLAVFDATTLGKSGIVTLDDVATRTPGFTMNRMNIGEPLFAIRGVGSASDSAAGDPTVGVFQDEIYVGRVSGAAFDLYDIERVEVLRGPQGTLYGRNTAGGAINIVPNRPLRSFEASARIGYGNYDAYTAQGVLNAPIGTRSAARLAVSHRQHAGYSTNIATGDDLDSAHGTSGRLGFSTEMTAATRLHLAVDWSRDDNGGNARVPGPVFTDQSGTDTVALAALLRLWTPGSDPRKAYSDPDSFQRRDLWGAMTRVDQDTSVGTLTVLAGWRSVKLRWFEDLDILKPFGNPPLPNIPPATYGWIISSKDRVHEQARQGSLELRLSSRADATTQWVTGVHYFDETVDRTESFNTLFSLVPAGSGDVSFIQNVDSKSAALYGQMTYPLGTSVGVTAGLRYTRDEKSALQVARNDNPADATPGIPLFPGQPYTIRADDSWNSLTGKLGVEYRVTETHLLYASANRGFKSGIFPSQNNVVQNVGVATPPEKVMSYEVGAKTDWFNRRVRINAALFDMDYRDLQLYRLDPQLRLVTFTEDASIYGAEFEFASLLARDLWFGATYAYLHARVIGGPNDDNVLPRAPEHKVGSYLEHAWAVAGGMLSSRIEYQWTDDISTEVPNTRVAFIPAYGLLDGRIAYRFKDHGLELSVWGKNLTDETYATHITPFMGNGFSVFGAPRTYGISVSWRTAGD